MRKKETAYTHTITSHGNGIYVPMDTWSLDCIEVIPQKNDMGTSTTPERPGWRGMPQNTQTDGAFLLISLSFFLPHPHPPNSFYLSPSCLLLNKSCTTDFGRWSVLHLNSRRSICSNWILTVTFFLNCWNVLILEYPTAKVTNFSDQEAPPKYFSGVINEDFWMTNR